MSRAANLVLAGMALTLPGCASFPDAAGGGRIVRAGDLKAGTPYSWSYDLGDPGFAAFLDRADLGSLDVKAALARAAARDAAVRIERGAKLPQIDGTAGWQRSLAGADRNARGVDMGVSASWTPDLSGAVNAAIDAARAEARAAGYDVEAARAVLAVDLARNWLALVALDDRLARIARRHAMESEGRALASRRIAAGYAAQDEALARETALARLADERLAVESDREAIRLRLLALAGLGPADGFGAPRGLDALLRFHPATIALDQLDARPDVKAAAARLAAADSRRLGEIRNARPRIVLSLGGQGGNLSLSSFLKNPGFSLVPGVRLEGAIFDGGKSRARADRAAAEAAEAEAMYLKATITAQQGLATALAAFLSAQNRQVPAVAAVRYAHQRLKLVSDRFARGAASRIDQIDAERGLVDAEEADAEARRALIAAGIEVHAALIGAG
ncbi:TolC family protein [Sphingomonas koreensis]